MSIMVTAVKNSRHLNDFLRLPRAIYRDDANWVAPLSSEVRRTLNVNKNPYFQAATLRLFIAYRNRMPVARLAIVINELHERKFGVRSAFFGYFETTNDEEAARGLFDEAEKYCISRGARLLEGPFSPNHYSELGLQVDSFGTPPSFFQPYNPLYYGQLLETLGFRISAHFWTMKNDHIQDFVRRRCGLSRKLHNQNGYSVRSLSQKDLETELERIREVNNDAFDSNWHFLPLSQAEYAFASKYMKFVTRPDLIKIVEHKGQIIAVLHCVLDINPPLKNLNGKVGPIKWLKFMMARRTIKKLIIYTVAIKKSYRHSRVSYLLREALRKMVQNFDVLETTWLSSENIPAVKAAESLGMRPDKHFAIYEKGIGA